MRTTRIVFLCLVLLPGFLSSGCDLANDRPSYEIKGKPTQWKRGNLHTHSFWSDGDDFPESILSWYRGWGYDFVAISDHNSVGEGSKWIRMDTTDFRYGTYLNYRARFGSAWVESEEHNDSLFVRLKRFDEYADKFNASGKFLVIHSEEITDGFDGKPIHVNATNIDELIPPQGGKSVLEVMQRNVDAVLRQRERTGIPMFPHINHPNFGWAINAMELAALEGERFIEVYNGHPSVNNDGDPSRPSVENMWDIANTVRVADGRPVLFGLAVDDSHNYQEMDISRSNPGRGWVMVETGVLSAASIVRAMEAGRFYSSSGVTLEFVESDSIGITISVQEEKDVNYRTLFIGTRWKEGMRPATGERGIIQLQDLDIGVVFSLVEGSTASYTFTGNELFVRARIVSSRRKTNPYSELEFERAWTQPVLLPEFMQ